MTFRDLKPGSKVAKFTDNLDGKPPTIETVTVIGVGLNVLHVSTVPSKVGEAFSRKTGRSVFANNVWLELI